jgi:hypothetical protein
MRSCEDVDEVALSYAEIKALCAGDERIKEKMDLDIDVARLRLLKADHRSQHFKLEDDLLTFYPEQITAVSERITGLEKDIAMYKEETAKAVIVHEVIASDSGGSKAEGTVSADGVKTESVSTPTFPPMKILGETYTDREAATKALHEAVKTVTDKNPVTVGSYLGFNMSVTFDTYSRVYKMTLKGNISHTFDLNTGTTGFITKINNELRSMPEQLERSVNQLENLRNQVKDAESALKEPFAQEAELADKEMRLNYLNSDLNIDGEAGEQEFFTDTPSEAPRGAFFNERDLRPAANMKEKPSILEGVRSRSADAKPPHTPGKDKPKEPTV